MSTSVVNHLRGRRGFSLIELAMVLAVIALMVAGIMLFYTNAQQSQSEDDVISELGVVVSVVHSLYAGTSNYSTLNTTLVAKSGLIPDKYLDPWGNIQTSFRGYFAVNNNDGQTFNVTLINLPRSACITIAQLQLDQSATAETINNVVFNSGSPFSMGDAMASCQDNMTNFVGWNFR